MTLSQHLTRALQAAGCLQPGCELQAERIAHDLTHPDYIPGGRRVRLEDCTHWRTADPGLRCCLTTGHDIQSGPYFCGKPAVVMSDTGDGHVALCAGHRNRLPYKILKTLEAKHDDPRPSAGRQPDTPELGG
jgi:hypothetical protein